MNDLQKTIKLFSELGIGFTKQLYTVSRHELIENSIGMKIVRENHKEDVVKAYIRLILEDGHSKVDGYFGFATDFIFDENGKFLKVYMYED